MKKKSLCTFIIILILILSIFSGLSLNPVTISAASYPAVYIDPASTTGSSETLYVDAFHEDTGWNGWTRGLVSPWLDVVDSDVIYSKSGDGIGNFTFSDLTAPGTPISVSLDVYVYDGTGADVIQANLWDGSSWTSSHIFTPGSSWQWQSWDVTAILDTSGKIDGAEVRFTHFNPGGKSDEVYIDAAKLEVVGGAPGPGGTYTIDIMTNYTGSDITSYQFDLTYNADTLHITSVENGPVVVYGTHGIDYMFSVGPIDNIMGTLGVTGALIFDPANTVSGPGVLANVTFTVVGSGNSSIILGSAVQLNAWNGTAYEFIVDGATMPDHLGHSYFENGGGGDVAVTNVAAEPNIIYRPPGSANETNINVTVANLGLSNMNFSVVLYYGSSWTEIGTQTVINLASSAQTNVTFNWNVTYVDYGNHTLKAVRIHSHLNDNGTADCNPANDVAYSWVLVSTAQYPAVYLEPSPIVDPNLTPGNTFIVSVKTDYLGSDITSYQFNLAYNPDTLHITSVENGPVVVYGTHGIDYMFNVGPIDNIMGTLGVTGALIFDPANTVSGPGVLANVTFTVVGSGNSSIILGSAVQLNAWNGTAYEFIVDGATMPDHLGHSYFENGGGGDVAVTNVAPEINIIYRPPGSANETNINVTVANLGLSNMTFSVVLYYGSSWTEIGTQTVINLTSSAQTNVTFNWNVTYVDYGNHTLKAVRIHSHLNDNGTADINPANDVAYSWVLVSAVKYPAVYLEPMSIVDPNLTPGNTFIVSVKTDYLGSDITSYQFNLVYNADTLHITSVENGPVVVYGTHGIDYMFNVGPIDNIMGTLGVTGALIFDPANTVSGPGVLATVTFTVVGSGNSSITLGTSTQLNAWNGTAYEFIVDGATMPDHLGHSYFENGGGGDVAVTNVTRIPPPAGLELYVYVDPESWEMININVTVANLGLSNMNFSVTLYYNYSLAPGWNEIGTQTVINLTSSAQTNVTFSLNITTINAPISGYGNYTFKAVRIHSHLNDNGTADCNPANDVAYSWVYIMHTNHVLPGDTNGDGIVDIFDIASISAHWYPGPPVGSLDYDPAADLNYSASIDMEDIIICSAHYGGTLTP